MASIERGTIPRLLIPTGTDTEAMAMRGYGTQVIDLFMAACFRSGKRSRSWIMRQ